MEQPCPTLEFDLALDLMKTTNICLASQFKARNICIYVLSLCIFHQLLLLIYVSESQSSTPSVF